MIKFDDAVEKDKAGVGHSDVRGRNRRHRCLCTELVPEPPHPAKLKCGPVGVGIADDPRGRNFVSKKFEDCRLDCALESIRKDALADRASLDRSRDDSRPPYAEVRTTGRRLVLGIYPRV